MGCGNSKTSDAILQDQDLVNQAYGQENRNIKGLKIDEVQIETHKTLNGMFKEEILEHGDEFGSVKPFLANIVPPENPPKENKKPPGIDLELQFIFGYRCHDVRQNIYWIDDSTIVYMSAAVGIVHNIENNKQKFLGGYEVKSDNDQHDDDIISIDYSSSSVQMVATGQRGIKPKIIVWSPADPKIIYLTLYQTKGTKEVSCLGFSKKGTYLGSIGKDPQKTFFVFDIQTKDCIWTSTIGTDIIFDLKFSSVDENEFCMVGMNNVYFAYVNLKIVKKGNYYEQKPTNHTCVQYLLDGSCITSTTIGSIYFWNRSRDCYKSLKLSDSTLHSLKFSPVTQKIYSGDAKNNLYIVNNFTIENTATLSSCVKAIDINSKGELILGLREGTIMLKNLETEEDLIVNMSHHDGEVWGLEYVPDKYVLTTGDDNKIILWDLTNFKNESVGKINEIPGTQKTISGSSSITEFPVNQCARSVTYNPILDHVAIGICDGSLSIRRGLLNLNERLFDDILISKEWIEVMKYSPNYKYLAVGCHDKVIYILDSNEDYAKLKTLRDHSSFIRCLDWDIENEFIQSVCGNREYLFFDVKEGKQERKVMKLRNKQWNTFTCKYGWPVQGVFMGSNNPDFINCVYRSNNNMYLVSGDEEKRVNVYCYPCLRDKPLVKRYKAHSGSVIRNIFNHNDTLVISIGEQDKTVSVWKVNSE